MEKRFQENPIYRLILATKIRKMTQRKDDIKKGEKNKARWKVSSIYETFYIFE